MGKRGLSLFRIGKRISIIAAGYGGKWVEELLFDWLIYGAVVAWATTTYGPYWGSLLAFGIMAPISALFCWQYIRVYDWSERDWFGFELMKETRDSIRGENIFVRLFHRILKLGDIPAFILLSINGDPFLTTIYLRKGAEQYSGLTKRDTWIFFGSVLLSNGYWTLRWTVVVELARIIWRVLHPILGL